MRLKKSPGRRAQEGYADPESPDMSEPVPCVVAKSVPATAPPRAAVWAGSLHSSARCTPTPACANELQTNIEINRGA
jgi:hypothetical protein